MERRWITVPLIAFIVLCIGASPQPASAFLTINLFYTGTPANEPSYDPGGTNLMAIMNAAADHWGRATGIIQDNHAITIDISWANLNDANGTLGLHTNLDGGGVPKPSFAKIQMDTQLNGIDRLWYFDPTPTDHSEYNVQKTYYGSLGAANQTAWFNGAPPNLLEVGYRGNAVAGAPAAALNGNDALSTAIHEIGHALGLTTNVATPEVLLDGDYDINPNFVGGATMAVVDNGFHIAPITALMCQGCGANGVRRLPSAVDVFSAASASNWTNLFLKRRDYLGGVVFNDPAAWVGGKTPNFTSDASVRSFGSGGITVAQSSMQFQNLSVFDAWNVTALPNNILLDVAGTTTIDGSNTVNGSTKIVLQGSVSPGSLLETDDLLLVSGGRVELDGSIPFAAAKVHQSVDIDFQSSIFGHGFFNMVNNDVTDVLNNHGLIEADGGELRLAANSTINPVFDLDGDDPDNIGNVRAVTGDLSVFGQHVGEFEGLLRVGGGHRATFEHRFIVGDSSGLVLLDGNLIDPATVNGADLVLRGRVTVDKLGRVGKGPSDLATFEAPVHVSVPDSDDELRLEGPAVFKGGLYDGDGTIVQTTDITIESDTQFDAGTYDWGNSVPGVTHNTLVDTGARFTINSPTTGTPDNEYRGVMRIENGELEVNTASGWTLPPEGDEVVGVPRLPAGTLILQDRKSGADIPKVRGQDIRLGGNIISLGGPGAIESDLATEPTADIDVRGEAELLLQGATTYDGGNIHGPGILRQIGNAQVLGNTTIGTAKTDWDGNDVSPSSTTIQPGVLFQITSTQIDDTPLTDGYDGHVTISDTAALVVFTATPWRMEGLMTMQGQLIVEPEAIVDGVTMINTGRVEGNGWFQMSVESEGTIAPGQSAGKIRFEQDLTLNAGSIVEHEIGGIVPIIDFDQIGVGSTATLTGLLELSVIGGYVPFLDHEFDIITADFAVTGTFSSVLFPTLPGVAFCVKYGTNTVTITTGLIGDLDGDGFVGIQDLNLVLSSWNQNVDAGVWLMGDPTGDGFIGIEDLNVVLGNWNAGVPPVDTANIPEPGTAAVLGLVGLTALIRRRSAS